MGIAAAAAVAAAADAASAAAAGVVMVVVGAAACGEHNDFKLCKCTVDGPVCIVILHVCIYKLHSIALIVHTNTHARTHALVDARARAALSAMSLNRFNSTLHV